MLSLEALSVRYGKHIALDNVHLRVDPGETVVILGANGAGKSSLLKAISGLVTPEPGARIALDGHELAGVPPHRIPDEGIALVPEGRGIFTALTVDENLALGAYSKRARAGEARQREFIFDLFPRLAERRKQIAGTMSGGEQQMVAIARALMSNPRLLMLDEPSLGLAPVVVGELFDALGRIGASGVALLLVEQNVTISLQLAARGYLLEVGRVVGEGSAVELKEDPAVRRAFLGLNA
ncbi:ABC transporter ATP-binding protein [Roseibium marinum]|uniref:Branched-chain amino acid transport system ATP-binding protein n=1 Tax=Roseibium marinum TaxID=281252 RepID=A0A2S3UL08_9HYPH|nr:ABC transporter ATP-binding protein [Roseibium marinum]POF28397.1 branched-chain amino acid transport system ATP-binding protein [Roseibium marinum]